MNGEHKETPSPPTLVAPCDAVSVDGSELTFVWEPVDEAETYRLQVARTARFEDPILDEDIGAQTAVTVGNQFPTDGETFFWRVLAGSEGEWSEGGQVESFLATTEEEAEQKVARGDGSDSIDLARAGGRAETAEDFDFVQKLEEEKERGVAYEGVAAGPILGISVSIGVVIMVAVGVLFGWFEQVSNSAQSAATETQQYEEVRQAEIEATEKLQQYGVVNEEEGTYRIPIDRAMDLIATEEYEQRQEQSQ